MEVFLQQLINGITLGSIYGLIAIGYTMVFGIIGMVNFAHGDVFMLSTFIALIVFLVVSQVLGWGSIALDVRNLFDLRVVEYPGAIGPVRAPASDLYQYPLPGRSFYRLVQEDIDSRTQFLGVKRIDNNIGRTFDVKTLGSVNAKLVLQVSTGETGAFQLNIYDMSGKKVKGETWRLQAGMTQKEIQLVKGVYIWELRNAISTSC